MINEKCFILCPCLSVRGCAAHAQAAIFSLVNSRHIDGRGLAVFSAKDFVFRPSNAKNAKRDFFRFSAEQRDSSFGAAAVCCGVLSVWSGGCYRTMPCLL